MPPRCFSAVHKPMRRTPKLDARRPTMANLSKTSNYSMVPQRIRSRSCRNPDASSFPKHLDRCGITSRLPRWAAPIAARRRWSPSCCRVTSGFASSQTIRKSGAIERTNILARMRGPLLESSPPECPHVLASQAEPVGSLANATSGETSVPIVLDAELVVCLYRVNDGHRFG